MGQLEGKIALLTGASRGIGRGTARGLAREGANLVLVARDAEGLQQTAAAAIAQGVEVPVVPTDVKEEKQIEALIADKLDSEGLIPLCTKIEFNN